MEANSGLGDAGQKPRMLAQIRHQRILDALARTGAASVSAVASRFAVSEMTVRRDLIELEREGKLRRTHGGAVRSGKVTDGAVSHIDPDEPVFASRLTRCLAAKRAIAVAAAHVASGAQTLALDVGTTTYLLAGLLGDRAYTKIFTNSVRNAIQLASTLGEVYLPGGRIRGDEMAISGQAAVSQFETLWFDIAFVGVSGLNPQGIYDYSFEDAEMKRVYLRRATGKVVLCDSSKFDRMSLVHIGPLSQFDLLITDASPPAPLADALAAWGVDVLLAPVATGDEARASG